MVDEVGLHTDGWPLAELDHLAQTHAGSREVCIMADRVHELSRLFPRHGCACRGLAAKSPRGVDKLASSGYVLANAQQRRRDKSGVTVVCGIAGRSSSKRAESESRVREAARVTDVRSPVAPTAPSPALKTSIAPSSFTCLHMPRLRDCRFFFVANLSPPYGQLHTELSIEI
jgi:hypothetical protein